MNPRKLKPRLEDSEPEQVKHLDPSPRVNRVLTLIAWIIRLISLTRR